MKRIRFNLIIILTLVILSVIFFFLQLLIFNDLHESGFLFFQDLMFLPIHILLITFIMDRILSEREKRNRQDQLNIVICAFFSEIGNDTIKVLNKFILDIADITELLNIKPSWDDKDFNNAAKSIKDYKLIADCKYDDPRNLKNCCLIKKLSFRNV